MMVRGLNHIVSGPAVAAAADLGGAGADESVLFAWTVPNGNDESHCVAHRYEY